VVAGGVIGRYIYRHFQFSLSGERASLKEIRQEIEHVDKTLAQGSSETKAIMDAIQSFTDLREKQKSRGFFSSLILLIRLDRLEKRVRRQIRRLSRSQGPTRMGPIVKNPVSHQSLMLKRVRLEKNISALEATSSLFAYWHKLHVPFIWILGFTMIAHIAAVLVF